MGPGKPASEKGKQDDGTSEDGEGVFYWDPHGSPGSSIASDRLDAPLDVDYPPESSLPRTFDKKLLYRRGSRFSLQDDRASVITLARSSSRPLARSSSRQISRPWEPESVRHSNDQSEGRIARSEADTSAFEKQHDIEQPLLVQAHDINHDTSSEISADGQGISRRAQWCMNVSLAVNVFLLIVKCYAFWVSKSKAILASAADSMVDIASQLVIAYAEYKVHTADPKFPVGRTRLEAVGVVSCAVIMTIATIEVIQSAAYDIVDGIEGHLPELEMGLMMYIILGTASVLKVILWLYTVALQNTSDSMMALAEDHRNDILSNTTAIVCGAIASITTKLWWADPVGAILISLYIISSWMAICKNQVDKVVGKGAPEEFVNNLEEMANSHHDLLIVDVIRAYFFGSRFLVEMEVILPGEMTVRESHDIALKLQHKLEAFDEVERAFVHVDYQMRDEPEHKLERNLMNKSTNLFESHDSITSQ